MCWLTRALTLRRGRADGTFSSQPAPLEQFQTNRRALWSLIIFCVLFGLSLFAEFIANDKPILVSYRGELYTPVFKFYPETTFGGDFRTEAVYSDPVVQCLIATGGVEDCFDYPEDILEGLDAGKTPEELGLADYQKGWALWPIIPLQL